jgi:hypothetical protein
MTYHVTAELEAGQKLSCWIEGQQQVPTKEIWKKETK